MPPVITSEQKDVVVASSAIMSHNANLALPCTATGDPDPVIDWFVDASPVPEEYVRSDGWLVRNITDGNGASTNGTTYYCTATNYIGPKVTLKATARSRDIIVTYACKYACVYDF